MDYFFKKLLEDKAEHLAFYFMINDFIEYNKLNIEFLFDKFRLIYTSYSICFNELFRHHQIYRNNKDIKKFSEFIIKNNNINNIFKINYGTEGHILDFFLDFNKNQDDYVKKLIDYINGFKEEKFEKQVYTFDNYLNKIGCDLAIYQFIYTNNELITDFSNYDIMFQTFFENAYTKFKEQEFIDKIKEIYNEENENKSASSKRLIKKKDLNNITLLQQYFNIYKYSTKIRHNNSGKIVYYNTIKITFKINNDIYKDIIVNTNYFYNLIKIVNKSSIIKSKTKSFDEYHDNSSYKDDKLDVDIDKLEDEFNILQQTFNIKETNEKILINYLILVSNLILAYLNKTNINMNYLISEYIAKINYDTSLVISNNMIIIEFINKISELLSKYIHIIIIIYKNFIINKLKKKELKIKLKKKLKNKLRKGLSKLIIHTLENSSINEINLIIRTKQEKLKSDNEILLVNDDINKFIDNIFMYFIDIKLYFYCILLKQDFINIFLENDLKIKDYQTTKIKLSDIKKKLVK